MAGKYLIPRASAPFVDRSGNPTREWYSWLRALDIASESSSEVVQAEIEAIARALGSPDGSVAKIPPQQTGKIVSIDGYQSVQVIGPLEDGSVTLSLQGDTVSVPAMSFYGALDEFARGWQTFSANFAKLNNGDDTYSLDLADVEDTGTGALLAVTRDGKGRISGTRAATITGTAGRVTVAHGDASDGLPTIDLAEVSATSGGTLQLTEFDAYGRRAKQGAATTTDLAEGTNLYYTDERASAAAPVQSVNGQTGDISLDAADVGAATAAQGAKADTALQDAPNDGNTYGRKDGAWAVAAGGGGSLPPGYIDGLKMQWVSGTAITITSGAAYIESAGAVLMVSAAIAKAGLSLTASTWYHAYLYDNAGTPDIEISTAAPAAPYNGTARSKAGDASRRYVGSVRVLASGAIAKFAQSGGRISYEENIQSDVFSLVVAGSATTATTLTCAGATPTTATHVSLSVYNNSASVVCWLANADCNFSLGGGGNFLQIVGIRSTVGVDMPMAHDRSIQYVRSGSEAGGANVSAVGYLYER